MFKNLILFLLIGFAPQVFAQAPKYINYQGIARDASGTPIINTNVNIQFKIETSTDPNFYSETQMSVPVNSLGLLNTQIGKTVPLPIYGWEDFPAILNISIDINGSGFVPMGSQTLATVPYALYALNSGGNGLPSGTRNGQTLRWDSINNVWANNNNLTADNFRVAVGLFPNEINSKFSVATVNPFDTAAITAVHYVAQNRTAAIRGIALGTTISSPSVNPYSTAIFGGQHVAYNASSGFAIGNGGYASSKGYGVGLAGFGSTQLLSGTAVGLYATTDSTSPGTKKYAAIFDRGGVFINDSLILNPLKNPGAPGDVLTFVNNGRAKWQSPGGGTQLWQRSLFNGAFNTFLANPSDDVSIGLPSGVAANEKFHLHNTGGDAYIQLSTTGSSNSVGFVFGQSSNLSKAFMRFDNFSNSLIYNSGGKSILHIDGQGNSMLGHIPNGAVSISALSIYDSISIQNPKPVLKIVNTNNIGGSPSSVFIGHNSPDGFTISYRKGSPDVFSFEDPFLSQKFHTFNNAGRFFPGSDGAIGKANIQGGPTINDDLTLNPSTNGNVVSSGYTQLGGNNPAIFPPVKVIEFNLTMPATAGGNITVNLSSYITSPAQIESVQLLVTTANKIVPQNFTINPGYECQYEITPGSPNIIVWTSSSNSSIVLNKPVKVLVTIKK